MSIANLTEAAAVKRTFFTAKELNESAEAGALIQAAMAAFGENHTTSNFNELPEGFDVVIIPQKRAVEGQEGKQPSELLVLAVPSVELALASKHGAGTIQDALLVSHLKRITSALGKKDAPLPETVADFMAPKVSQRDLLRSFDELARPIITALRGKGLVITKTELQTVLSSAEEAAARFSAVQPEVWPALLGKMIALCANYERVATDPQTGETTRVLAPLDDSIFQHWLDNRDNVAAKKQEAFSVDDLGGLMGAAPEDANGTAQVEASVQVA